MPWIPHNTDILHLHRDLYAIFLGNLSFRNLNEIADSELNLEEIQKHATQLLQKESPTYRCLQRAKQQGHYSHLIDNLLERTLPLYNKLLTTNIFNRNRATYESLCRELGPLISTYIKSVFVSRDVHHVIDEFAARDFVFHYCQYNPEAAGQLLNKLILETCSHSNSYLATFLIQYGANVNAKEAKATHSTLFHALTFNSSAEMIRLLVDHGADYDDYREERHGIHYTLMLITALNHNLEGLSVLVERFPEKLSETLDTLDTMLATHLDEGYSCEEGSYKTVDARGKLAKLFYSQADIAQAKTSLLTLICMNTPEESREPASARRFSVSFFNGLEARPQEEALLAPTQIVRASSAPPSV